MIGRLIFWFKVGARNGCNIQKNERSGRASTRTRTSKGSIESQWGFEESDVTSGKNIFPYSSAVRVEDVVVLVTVLIDFDFEIDSKLQPQCDSDISQEVRRTFLERPKSCGWVSNGRLDCLQRARISSIAPLLFNMIGSSLVVEIEGVERAPQRRQLQS